MYPGSFSFSIASPGLLLKLLSARPVYWRRGPFCVICAIFPSLPFLWWTVVKYGQNNAGFKIFFIFNPNE